MSDTPEHGIVCPACGQVNGAHLCGCAIRRLVRERDQASDEVERLRATIKANSEAHGEQLARMRIWPDDVEAGFSHAIEVAALSGASDELLASMQAEWDRNAKQPRGPYECFWCASVRDLAPLNYEKLSAAQRFAGMVMAEHRDDLADLDGGWLQEKLVECGLAESREVSEPCGEYCRCAEVSDFPLLCYFPTPAGDAALAAKTKP